MGDETRRDKLLEERARTQLEHVWSCNVHSNPPFYPFDWQLFDLNNNECLGLAEFKTSSEPIEDNIKKYGGFRIDIKKLMKGYCAWVWLTKLPLFVVFRCSDEKDLYFHKFEHDRNYGFPASRFWRGRKDKPQDKTPCLIITPDEFKKVEENDLDPIGGVAY
tara:strand:+ start:62 stop:547 length:486 start_codon:yes stop_codon:yes gene_type:complete